VSSPRVVLRILPKLRAREMQKRLVESFPRSQVSMARINPEELSARRTSFGCRGPFFAESSSSPPSPPLSLSLSIHLVSQSTLRSCAASRESTLRRSREANRSMPRFASTMPLSRYFSLINRKSRDTTRRETGRRLPARA